MEVTNNNPAVAVMPEPEHSVVLAGEAGHLAVRSIRAAVLRAGVHSETPEAAVHPAGVHSAHLVEGPHRPAAAEIQEGSEGVDADRRGR